MKPKLPLLHPPSPSPSPSLSLSASLQTCDTGYDSLSPPPDVNLAGFRGWTAGDGSVPTSTTTTCSPATSSEPLSAPLEVDTEELSFLT